MTLLVTADVQSWIDLSAGNYGWRLSDQDEAGASSADAKYATREDGTVADHPLLKVEYIL